MTDLMLAAAVLASLEVNPGQPSDLTQVISSPALRQRLLARRQEEGHADGLIDYLWSQQPPHRREHWYGELVSQTRRGIRVLIAGEPDYPERLMDVWDAPPLLFTRGELSSRYATSVAVVGSRQASPSVLEATRELSGRLARDGIDVVSGLAAGVDTAAHQGALDAGGHTVAVFGCGLDHVYPPENAQLSTRIAANGALVSQFAPQAPPTSTTFLLRNRVIAGMTRTSIVMAAAARSGSRHEAASAVEYGRRVLLWAPALADETWARAMVDSGAAMFVAGVEEAAAAA